MKKLAGACKRQIQIRLDLSFYKKQQWAVTQLRKTGTADYEYIY
jgi:hypothetical protein